MPHIAKLALGLGLFAIIATSTASSSFAQRVVKTEPALGTLQGGQFVYVDNGKCPKGQILKVTAGVQYGGGRGSANSNMKGGAREKVCVPRPN